MNTTIVFSLQQVGSDSYLFVDVDGDGDADGAVILQGVTTATFGFDDLI
jgi:hypothetical protein